MEQSGDTSFVFVHVEGADSPVVEAAVDDGVVHGGAHSQPHDGQVNLLDERLLEHLWKELVQQEIDVVGQPADGERAHHHDHHLHHLLDTCDITILFYRFAKHPRTITHTQEV